MKTIPKTVEGIHMIATLNVVYDANQKKRSKPNLKAYSSLQTMNDNSDTEINSRICYLDFCANVRVHLKSKEKKDMLDMYVNNT